MQWYEIEMVVQGIYKAKQVGFIDWHLPHSSFNLKKYEFYEQVRPYSHTCSSWRSWPGALVQAMNIFTRAGDQRGLELDIS